MSSNGSLAFVATTPSVQKSSAFAKPESSAVCTQVSASSLTRTSAGSFVARKNVIGTFEGFKPATSFVPTVSPEESGEGDCVIKMANLKEIRDRITSVKNTQKVTEAMKLVAAAKVRRAQEAVMATRPFSEQIVRVLFDLQNRLKLDTFVGELPLVQERPVKKVALLVITGDRGLCGGFNTFVIKEAAARAAALKAQGIAYEFVIVGRKAEQFFGRRSQPIAKSWGCPASPTAAFSAEISEFLANRFLEEEVDRVEAIYTRFVNLISSRPVIQSLLPLAITGFEAEIDEIFRLTSKDGKFSVERETEAFDKLPLPRTMIFEQDPVVILNALLPLYLDAQVYRSLYESVTSELSSRMTAMTSASDNAKALSKELLLGYNRARQAMITQELLEIVSGANAISN